MKKRIWVVGAVFGLGLGIFLTIKNDWISPSRAVDYYHEGSGQQGQFAQGDQVAPPVQPAGFLSGNALPDFADLAKKVRPAVVNISTTKNAVKRRGPVRRSPRGGPQDPFDDFFEHFFGPPGGGFGGPAPERPQKSLGSGFVINEEGYILTNNHVIEGADEIQVQFPDKGPKREAKIIGSDPKTDIAVIKIADKGLPFVQVGDSAKLEIGQWVMAVGNPFGLDSTVTVGVVSAKGRIIGAGPYDDFIQTDASINPGNSGGPLFNEQGQVVGINTAIVASGQGIGFAIPINLAKDLIPQLISKGKVTRAWLGVGIQDITPELAQSFKLPDQKGALISNVFPDSPAAKGGLKSGDIVRKFDGQVIGDSHELPTLVARLPVGKRIAIEVLRDGGPKALEIVLGEMEEGEKQAEASLSKSSDELGITVRPITPEEALEQGMPQPESGKPGSGKGQRGVLVVSVDPSSSVAQVGIQPGDVLLKVNDDTINGVDDFVNASRKTKKGGVIRLYIWREGASIYLAFTK